MNQCIFTIVAKNYIGLAQILEKSIHKRSSTLEFFIIVADEPENINTKDFPGNCLFAKHILDIEDSLWQEMAFKYSLTEFCTSIKPKSLEYFLYNKNYEKVIYLDPDILFFDSIEPLFSELDQFNVVITPHISEIHEYSKSDAPENVWLQCGMFNLGFIAIKRSITSLKILRWWHSRLVHGSFIDGHLGLFTDQKWIDFLPSIVPNGELLIKRDLGLNVAPWNFFERKVIRDNEGKYLVADRHTPNGAFPLIFVHYSAYDYIQMQQGIVVQNGVKNLYDYDDIKLITSFYTDELIKNRETFSLYSSLSYTYNVFHNGDAIEGIHRRLYRSLVQHGTRFEFPFSFGEGSFHQLLKRRGIITSKSTGVDKMTKGGNKSITGTLRIFNRLTILLFKIIGLRRYLLLIRLLRPFSRFEAQIHLVDDKAINYNIFEKNEIEG